MKIVLYLLCVIVVLFGLCNSSAQALTRIGVPAATLKQDQFAAGFSFAHSKGDIEASSLGITVTVPDSEVDTYMANLCFGAHKNWEFLIDLGVSDSSGEYGNSRGDFTGGFGVRTTWVHDDKFKLGSVVTVHFYEASGSGYDLGIYWQETDKWSEIQFAIGPSYNFGRWCLYGGPFLHLIDGKFDGTVDGFSISGDFEQKNLLGGFLGAQFDLKDNVVFGIECQHTGSAYAIGASILWKF